MRRVRAPDTEIRCDLAVASRSLPMRTGARGLRGVLIRRMIGERYRRGRAPAFRPFRSHSLAPVLNHHGRDERLLVRASKSSRYSYSEGRASRPRHAATRCDRRAAVMERIVWGRHSCLPAQPSADRNVRATLDTHRHLSIPVATRRSRGRGRGRGRSVSVWGRHSCLPAQPSADRNVRATLPASSLASLDGGRATSPVVVTVVECRRVIERFMERAQAPGARGLRGMITARWRTPPPWTAVSTLRLSRSPGTVYTISYGSTGRFGSAGRWRDKAWRQGVGTRCRRGALTPNPHLIPLLIGTLTLPA